MDKTLASAIKGIAEFEAIDGATSNHLDNLDLPPILVYLIDTAPSVLLQDLAIQFNVLGVKGYGIAQTDTEKRAVIKKAIELHRYKGTPYAIIEALKTIGYNGAQVIERLNQQPYHDGSFNRDGSRQRSPLSWATFRVIVDIGNAQGISPQTNAYAVALINEYKNVRSRLVDLSFSANIAETVQSNESLTVNVQVITSTYHNGIYSRDGSIDRSGNA